MRREHAAVHDVSHPCSDREGTHQMLLRRHVLVTSVVVISQLTVACSETSPEVDDDAGGPGGCEITGVTLSTTVPVGEGFVFTAAREVSTDGASTVHVDSPVTTWLEWTAADPSRTSVLEWIATELGVPSEASSGLLEVDDFLASVDDNTPHHIGYSSVTKVMTPVRVTCREGEAVSGTLHSWADSEIGAVLCDEDVDQGAARARQARDEFCPR